MAKNSLKRLDLLWNKSSTEIKNIYGKTQLFYPSWVFPNYPIPEPLSFPNCPIPASLIAMTLHRWRELFPTGGEYGPLVEGGEQGMRRVGEQVMQGVPTGGAVVWGKRLL